MTFIPNEFPTSNCASKKPKDKLCIHHQLPSVLNKYTKKKPWNQYCLSFDFSDIGTVEAKGKCFLPLVRFNEKLSWYKEINRINGIQFINVYVGENHSVIIPSAPVGFRRLYPIFRSLNKWEFGLWQNKTCYWRGRPGWQRWQSYYVDEILQVASFIEFRWLVFLTTLKRYQTLH